MSSKLSLLLDVNIILGMNSVDCLLATTGKRGWTGNCSSTRRMSLRRYIHTNIHGTIINNDKRGRNHHGQNGRSRVCQFLQVTRVLYTGGGGLRVNVYTVGGGRELSSPTSTSNPHVPFIQVQPPLHNRTSVMVGQSYVTRVGLNGGGPRGGLGGVL